MKYVVQVKYTNPAHEHVSLRRRVETVNRIVEAANEQEAINRVANQQRSLGFMIKESAVVNTGAVEQSLAAGAADNKKKKIVGDEDEETEIKKEPVKEAVKSGNEGRGYHGEHPAEVADKNYADAHANVMKVVGNASSTMVKHYLDSRHGRHLVGREGNHEYIRTDFDKFKKEYNPKMFEEAEQIDERNKQNALARKTLDALRGARFKAQGHYVPDPEPQHKTDLAHNKAVGRAIRQMSAEEVELTETASHVQYSGKVNDKDYTLTIPRNKDISDYSEHQLHRKLTKENPHLEHHEVTAVARTNGEEEDHVTVEHGGKTYTHKVINHQEPERIYEDAEQTDEAKKWSRAEWRMGTETDVDKNNKKIYDRLSATDPAKAKAFHDNLMRMKRKDVKEETDADKREAGYKMSPAVRKAQAASDALSKDEKKPQAGTLAAKSRKAAERMVNLAKGKANQVNLEPSVDVHKVPGVIGAIK